mmetsp:Transcript_77197/g.213448  ORF Transcript_77197/g.213448 Transcript_77197/m.213448 type:complete len:444 (+) Transcript_77197:152-1483(+)
MGEQFPGVPRARVVAAALGTSHGSQLSHTLHPLPYTAPLAKLHGWNRQLPCCMGCRCSLRATAGGPKGDSQPCASAEPLDCCSAFRTRRPTHAPRSSLPHHGRQLRLRNAVTGGGASTERRQRQLQLVPSPSEMPWQPCAVWAAAAGPPRAGCRPSCGVPRGSRRAAATATRAPAASSGPQRRWASSGPRRSRPPRAQARRMARLAAFETPPVAPWLHVETTAATHRRRPLGPDLRRDSAVPGVCQRCRIPQLCTLRFHHCWHWSGFHTPATTKTLAALWDAVEPRLLLGKSLLLIRAPLPPLPHTKAPQTCVSPAAASPHAGIEPPAHMTASRRQAAPTLAARAPSPDPTSAARAPASASPSHAPAASVLSQPGPWLLPRPSGQPVCAPPPTLSPPVRGDGPSLGVRPVQWIPAGVLGSPGLSIGDGHHNRSGARPLRGGHR